MSKKTITKGEFTELTKVMDPLEIIQRYAILESVMPTLSEKKIDKQEPSKSLNSKIDFSNEDYIIQSGIKYSYVDISRRLLLLFVDLIIIFILLSIFFAAQPFFVITSDFTLPIISSFIIIILYYTISECLLGVTVAKKLFGYTAIIVNPNPQINSVTTYDKPAWRALLRFAPFIFFPLVMNAKSIGLFAYMSLGLLGIKSYKNQFYWDQVFSIYVVKKVNN